MRYEQMILDAAYRNGIDSELLRYAWDGSKHPRGNQKNKGQFAKGKGTHAADVAVATAKPNKSVAKPKSKRVPTATRRGKQPVPAAQKGPKSKGVKQDAKAAEFWSEEADRWVQNAMAAIDNAGDDESEQIAASAVPDPASLKIPPAASKAAESIVSKHLSALADKIKGLASGARDAVKSAIAKMGLLCLAAWKKAQPAIESMKRTAQIISVAISIGSAAAGGIGGTISDSQMPDVPARTSTHNAEMSFDRYRQEEDKRKVQANMKKKDKKLYDMKHAQEGMPSMEEIKAMAKEYYGGIMADVKAWNGGKKHSYYDQVTHEL